MPVFFEGNIRQKCFITLWYISESEDTLREAYAPHVFGPVAGKHRGRRVQSLAAALCAKRSTEKAGTVFKGVDKDENGKPFLRETAGALSLSHTKNYAGASFCADGTTGIDLEHLSNMSKVRAVASKFMNDREIRQFGTHDEASLLCWSTKETLYKLTGKPVSLKDRIHIYEIKGEKSGTIRAIVLHGTEKENFLVNYSIFDEFVCTCAFKI